MTDYTPTTSVIRCVATNWDVKTKKKNFDRWLAEVKAQAWEEGHRSRLRMYENDNFASLQENPYRQGEEQ